MVTCRVLKIVRQLYYRWPAGTITDRTVWRICSYNGWWSVFGKKKRKNGKPGVPAHDDLVEDVYSNRIVDYSSTRG